MYHLRLKGNHYEVGVKRGNIFNKCNITFPLHLDEFQMNHGIKSEKILKKYFPEVCEEIKGITDIINIDYMTFASWLLAMGCCMYNLEDNHPVEIKGCTAFAVQYKNNVYYGRNNDLPPFLKDGSKSEIYKLDNSNTFNITTSSFINGEEGMNEKGLVVAMTFVLTDLKDIKPGFNSVFVVRYLLEKANNVDGALKLLLDLPVASNMNILLADRSGEMIVIECSPNKKHIRKPTKFDNGIKYICTINSFISKEMKDYECKLEDTYLSEERYQTVYDALKKYKNEDMSEYIRNLLKGDYGFMCQYKKSLNFDTVWSSIFNLKTLEISRAEGNPRRNKFIYDKRLMKGEKNE